MNLNISIDLAEILRSQGINPLSLQPQGVNPMFGHPHGHPYSNPNIQGYPNMQGYPVYNNVAPTVAPTAPHTASWEHFGTQQPNAHDEAIKNAVSITTERINKMEENLSNITKVIIGLTESIKSISEPRNVEINEESIVEKLAEKLKEDNSKYATKEEIEGIQKSLNNLNNEEKIIGIIESKLSELVDNKFKNLELNTASSTISNDLTEKVESLTKRVEQLSEIPTITVDEETMKLEIKKEIQEEISEDMGKSIAKSLETSNKEAHTVLMEMKNLSNHIQMTYSNIQSMYQAMISQSQESIFPVKVIAVPSPSIPLENENVQVEKTEEKREAPNKKTLNKLNSIMDI